MGLDTSSNGNATVTMTTNGPGGLHISVQFQVSECDHFDVPPCPTADGRLDGTDSSPLLLRTTITQNGTLLRSESVEIEDTQKLAGQVADDAKLDTLDIADSYRFRSSFAGSQLAHAVSINGAVELQTRVDMRSGLYSPGHGGVIVNATVDGASLSAAELAGLASQSEAEADAAFAKVAAKEIARYHARETNIDKPGECAQLTFNPVSDTLTVNSGDQGHFTGHIESKEGGDASKARWTLSGQKNASFSPSSTENPQPSFSYDVSGSPSSNTFTTHVKATSTAGVAQGDWSQKLKTLRTISGTFTGQDTGGGSGTLSWSGTATFQRADTGAGIAGSFQLIYRSGDRDGVRDRRLRMQRFRVGGGDAPNELRLGR